MMRTMHPDSPSYDTPEAHCMLVGILARLNLQWGRGEDSVQWCSGISDGAVSRSTTARAGCSREALESATRDRRSWRPR
jgi:hypothetical protein